MAGKINDKYWHESLIEGKIEPTFLGSSDVQYIPPQLLSCVEIILDSAGRLKSLKSSGVVRVDIVMDPPS